MKALNKYLINESKEYNKEINIKGNDIYCLITTGDDLMDVNERSIDSFVGIYSLTNLINTHFDDGFVIADDFDGDDKKFESKLKSLHIGEVFDIEGTYVSHKIIKIS